MSTNTGELKGPFSRLFSFRELVYKKVVVLLSDRVIVKTLVWNKLSLIFLVYDRL